MKKIYNNIFLPLLLLSFVFAGCEDKYTEEYLELEPVYMNYKDFREAVKVETTKELKKPGKIYAKGNYLFINELMKGIHIYNNSNPASPQYAGFINIPGNVDIAINGNVLYADSYIDLVAIDISNMSNIKEISRVKSVFPYSIPPYESGYRLGKIDDTQGVIVDWEVKKVRKELENISYPVYPIYFASKFAEFAALDATSNGSSQSSNSSSGIAGSMARFGLIGNYLVAVDNSTYYSFDLTDAQSPKLKATSGIGWNIETMFLLGNTMFLGTSTGMLIFDITDITKPNYISNFWHVTGCDPVVVQNNRAYVTIRGGNLCGSTVNRLDVLDVTNLRSPSLIRSYNMEGPYGLGIDDDVLFVCDGDAGLKIYNASDPYLVTENLIAKFSDIHAYDVIPLGTSLLMIGEDGFYQYDYSDLTKIKQISSIKVKK
jgi:hypothetical protein